MKKIIFIFLMFVCSIGLVNAKEVNLYLFYGDGCPHCAKEKEYFKELESKYDNLNIHQYEVWYDEDNQNLLSDVKDALNSTSNYVPYTVIGEKYFIGFNDDTKLQLEKAINNCIENDCEDIVSKVINGEEIKWDKQDATDNNQISDNKKDNNDEHIKNIPLIGKVNVKKFSLPLIAIVMGLVDGFNPCAMWVLIFLISMLVNSKNKKRMWILGLTFLCTSALIYLLFMVAWLNIAIKMNTVIWLRTIIAIVAVIAGLINLRSFYRSIKKDVGCEVVNNDKRKAIIEKIKKFTNEKSLFLAIVGIIALAVSVNFIELACSAGLPLLFTQILALNNLSGFSYFMYILIYILFYLIDDIIVFAVAIFTFKVTGISNKYSKYSHLIGGVIMLLIGILLIFFPNIIMFNF